MSLFSTIELHTSASPREVLALFSPRSTELVDGVVYGMLDGATVSIDLEQDVEDEGLLVYIEQHGAAFHEMAADAVGSGLAAVAKALPDDDFVLRFYGETEVISRRGGRIAFNSDPDWGEVKAFGKAMDSA